MADLKPLLVLKNSIFRRQYLSKDIFPNPTTLTVNPGEKWVITGSNKSILLDCLAGKNMAIPSSSRVYPFLNSKTWPASVMKLISFNTDVKPAYLSARYESYREPEDVSLMEFLKKAQNQSRDGVPTTLDKDEIFDQVVKRLNLTPLLHQWIVTLSNGQTRRARIARGLLSSPEVLLADEPFLGLDPAATSSLSDMLGGLAPNPHVILGLRVHEPLPDWVTHVALVDDTGVTAAGTRADMKSTLQTAIDKRESVFVTSPFDFQKAEFVYSSKPEIKTIIDIDDITIAYRGKVVLKNLKWVVKRGERWHLRGNNGTGKSTLLSLLTADHPQSWNSKIRLFDSPRKVGRQNYFSINRDIGHVSPEIHAIFPVTLTAFQAVSTGFTIGSYLPPSNVTHMAGGSLTKDDRDARIKMFLDHFKVSADSLFSDLTLNDQKLVLFMRAIIKNPEILILDEAFSGMNDESIARCKNFVDVWGGTVIAIGHVDDEIPRCSKYIRLHGGENLAEIGDISSSI
ncbi:P-loop containing nucleoside triphosphate hydrolase protein [Lipomyces arxii]|uniref:P-loop containing nucleoside triphosphate hydrolase protein n=1 Tax=Lipomyces arxii TaxID=56418 RepID=UPI0034CD9A5D